MNEANARHTTLSGLQGSLQTAVNKTLSEIGDEISSRGYRIANELRNNLNMVMRGDRHGRRYKIPGTYRKRGAGGSKKGKQKPGAYYAASAPGEPPAVRTGAFRASWHSSVQTRPGGNAPYDLIVRGAVESGLRVGRKGYLLGEMLENGTTRMRPRPYKKRTIEGAMPRIQKVMREPYLK